MAIPKTGSRIICVDNIAYRWLIRRKATYEQECCADGFLNVAIELAASPRTTLLVWTNHPHPQSYFAPTVTPVTPSHITKWIREALEKGWKPEENGATFELSVRGTTNENPDTKI